MGFITTGISLASFLLMNISVFLSCVFLNEKFFKLEDTFDNLINIGVLYLSQIIFYETILGTIGLLTQLNLLIVTISGSFITISISQRKSHLKTVFLSEIYQRVKKYLGENRFLQLVVIVCLFFLLYQFFYNLVKPPYEGDSLWHHLPKAVNWLQGRTIIEQKSPQWFFPGNSELIALWLIIPFHNDLLVNFQNFPFLFLVLLSVYALCRKIGIHKKWAIYGALLLFSAPGIRGDIGTASNDIGILALFLVSLNYILSYRKREQIGSILFLSFSLGLLLGLKHNGFYYIFLLVFIYFLASKFRRRFVLRDMSLLCLGILVLGGFWYIRNYLLIGNPFAPAEIRLFGRQIFPGEWRFDWLKKTSVIYYGNYARTAPMVLKALLSRGGIVGLLSLPIIILSSTIVILNFLQTRRTRLIDLILLCFVPLATLFIFLITPTVIENVPRTLNQIKCGPSVRFGMVFLAMTHICLSYLFDLAQATKLSTVNEAFVGGIVGMNLLFRQESHKVLTLTYLVSVIIFFAWQISLPKIEGKKRACFLILGFLVFLNLVVFELIKYRKEVRGRTYGYWLYDHFGHNFEYTELYRWFDRNIERKRILVEGLRTYPFYGPSLNNEVFLNNRSSGDPVQWKNFLVEEGIDIVVMARMSGDSYQRSFGEFPPAEKNLLLFPEIFVPVFSDSTAHVYKVVKTSSQ